MSQKETIVKCPGCGAGVLVAPGKKVSCPLCSTECRAEAESPAPAKKGGTNA